MGQQTKSKKVQRASLRDRLAVKDTLSVEDHRAVFARLSNPIFNSGAMHGTPNKKKGQN